MKEETKEQLMVFVKLLVVFICAGLYAWGGMNGKYLRRFVAPSVCGFSMWYFTKDWKSLFIMPALGLASSLGYGADQLWTKIFKRAYVGLTFGLSASLYSILRKNWYVVGFTMVLLIAAYILFGVWNPLPNARHEETFLGVLVYLMPIMNTKKKEK